MPHVAALAVASWVAGTAITTASAAVAAGVATAAAYGLTYVATAAVLGAGMTALTAPKVGAQTKPPTEWQGDPNAPLPFILGRRGVGGYQVRKKEFGTDNRYMMVVTVVSAAGPVNAWESTKIDGVAYSQTGDRLNHPKFNNWAWRQVRLGAQPETAFTLPPGMEGAVSLPGWGANHKLSGKAAEMLILRQNGEFSYWPTEPRTVRVVQGLKVWDPRLDSTYPGGSGPCRRDNPATHIYSLNPIIHGLNNALGYWENGKLIGGIGASLRAVDVAAFVAAANISDLNAWKVSAEITTGDDKYQALQALLQAGGAIYTRINGRISCISRGAPRVSIATISAADTAGPIQIRTSAPREGRINTITPRCVQEDQDWEMTALEPVTSSAFVTEDGGERPAGIDYPYVPDANQAAQLAGLDLVKVREPFVGSVPLKPYMRHLKPGDAFTITEPDFLLDGVQCVVERRSFDVETSIATVEFSSDTPGAIEWALTREGTPPPTQTLTPPPTDFPAPEVGDWTAVAGTDQPSIIVTGAATNSQTENIIFEYRKLGSADWIVWTETTGTIQRVEITGLDALTDYQVRVTYRSIWGPRSDPTVLPTVTTGSSSATVSEDTEAVGGRPSVDVLDQVDQTRSGSTAVATAMIRRALHNLAEVKRVDTMTAQFGEAKISLTELAAVSADINGRLDGVLGFLFDADGRISGMQILTQGGSVEPITVIKFLADVVAFYDPDSDTDRPFLQITTDGLILGDNFIGTPSVVDNAITDTVSVQATSTTTQVNSVSFGKKILELTRNTNGGDVKLDFSAAWLIRQQQELYFYVFVDSDYNWTGSAESNHLYELAVETSSTGDIQNVTTFQHLITGLAAGAHTFRVYIRNTTGATVDIGTRTLTTQELKK